MCMSRLAVTHNMCNFDIATTKLSDKLTNNIALNVWKDETSKILLPTSKFPKTHVEFFGASYKT